MLAFLLALTVPVTSVALLYARWEYRKRGKLTVLGLALLCAMLFVPNLILEYATAYEMPSTLLDFVGVLVGGVGIALCLISIAVFHSVLKVLCIDEGKLTTAGPYRWSRNPQYVGWFWFLLGFALNDWSLWCLAASRGWMPPSSGTCTSSMFASTFLPLVTMPIPRLSAVDSTPRAIIQSQKTGTR